MALVEFQNNTAPYLNAENLNNNFNYLDEKAQEIYSTDEIIIGKWINNKPIYRKVINFGSLPNATTKDITHGITNLDKIIRYYGIAYATGSAGFITRILPASSPSGAEYTIDLYILENNIEIATAIDRSAYSAYIIIEYTKTTDEGDE